MIQRIQTLYLLGAILILLSVFFLPLAQFRDDQNRVHEIFANGNIVFASEASKTIADTHNTTLMYFFVLIEVLLLSTIFLYKKRMQQMRMCVYSIVLLFASVAMLIFFTKTLAHNNDSVRFLFTFPAFTPLISALFTFFAFRGIRKDEELIKSLNRIR